MSSGEGSENGMESHSDLSGEVTSSEDERKPGVKLKTTFRVLQLIQDAAIARMNDELLITNHQERDDLHITEAHNKLLPN